MSSYRSHASGYTRDDVAAAAVEGRRPSYDTNGYVRGFRSRPGASVSSSDTIAPLGIPDRSDPNHVSAWDRFFHRPQPAPGAPVGPATAPGVPVSAPVQDESSMGPGEASVLPFRPDVPRTADEHVAASLAVNSDWFSRQGVQVPPPGSPFPAPVQPVRSGWNVTSAQQAQQIANRYSVPSMAVKNPWGKPIPLS